MVPGLGLPAYLRHLARALEQRGAVVRLLDVPGFGTPGPLACAPHVEAIGEHVALALAADPPAGPLVLLGHSTGAQAALHAAVRLQRQRTDLSLVMAGPTFAPTQRGLAGLAFATPGAYRADSPRELVALPQAARGALGVLRLLRSGLADRPERVVARLQVPLVLTAGRRDSYAPRWWLDVLAASAVRAPSTRVVVLDGSHNNPFTRPDDVADVTLGR